MNVLIVPFPFFLFYLSTYSSLLHTKHSNFLISSINSASSSSSSWKNLNRVLSKQSPPPSFSSQDFHDYFHNKILSIRTNRWSSHTPPASFSASVSLFRFSPITFTDLIIIIKSVSSSSCPFDLILLKILNDLSSFFYPIILYLINLSQATSKFPTSFKSSVVTPILKKPSLDPSIISNYQPISNLSFFSKILEKAIYLQLSNFLLFNNLLFPAQPGFRPSHFTETCFLKIFNDALLAFDSGKLSLLLFLDFFFAFDTVDHSLLLQHLNFFCGIFGSSLSWITSYLSKRSSTVFIKKSSFSLPSVPFCVHQGSVLEPLLFFFISLISLILSSLSLFKVSFLLMTLTSSLFFLSLSSLLLFKGLVFVSLLFFSGVTPFTLN